MAMSDKQPKPKGKGNYTPCRDCYQTGWFYTKKHAILPGIRKSKQAFVGYICKRCKGSGWVDAER